MAFISYAQNFEDVLLWRALQHVKNGFYIDVGANDPRQHSVTNAFYERGWYGINIEPLGRYHQAFRDQRPRDINLRVAAGAEDGEITLFDVPAMPGRVPFDPDGTTAHEQEGFKEAPYTVPQRTLCSICEEYVSYDIHFLKINVEGYEAQVLRGMDFARWRPWIIVIEATLPNSRETNHEAWEAMVVEHDYQFAYFDGLNRYYVAHEHRDLLDALQIQANVFDDFISVHLSKAWQNGEATRALAEELSRQLSLTYASSSWRLTKPLRWLSRLYAKVFRNGLTPRRMAAILATHLRGCARQVLHRIAASQRLRNLLRPWLAPFPAIKGLLRWMGSALHQKPPTQSADVSTLSERLIDVSPSVRKVLADLEQVRRRSLNP